MDLTYNLGEVLY